MLSYYPTFSSNIFECSISEIEILDKLNEIVKTYPFYDDENQTKTSQSTLNKRVLDNQPIIKDAILNYFYTISSEVLKYSCKFDMTTSWFTKTTKNKSCHFHSHRNSFYSGILYFGEYTLNSSPVVFENPISQLQDFYIIPTEYNSLNATSWSISPSKGKLIFFPSYLMHKIDVHNENKVRYSLSFNIVPIGHYGSGDSTINTEWFS